MSVETGPLSAPGSPAEVQNGGPRSCIMSPTSTTSEDRQYESREKNFGEDEPHNYEEKVNTERKFEDRFKNFDDTTILIKKSFLKTGRDYVNIAYDEGSRDILDQTERIVSRPERSEDMDSCCSDDTVLSVGQESPSPLREASGSILRPHNRTLESHSPSRDMSVLLPGLHPSLPLTSFRGIHSHLNAISQITHGLSLGSLRPAVVPTGLFLGHRPLQSPPDERLSPSDLHGSPTSPGSPRSPTYSASSGHTQSPHPSHQSSFNNSLSPAGPNHNNNHDHSNNLNDNNNLKFSIDNILKADFGRRITDPLKRTIKPSKSKTAQSVPKQGPRPSDGEKSSDGAESTATQSGSDSGPMVWPAWVYCTRYSDRPSSGPRSRRPKKSPGDKAAAATAAAEEKRPRTAFSGPQLARLKHEFAENRYLTERRRQQLSGELGLNEAQIKIWFQNKRAKIKKASGHKNPLALQLMAQGLYNHSTVPLTREEEEMQELQNS